MLNRDNNIVNQEYLRVKVIPGQHKAEFRDTMDDGTIKIALTSQPERGKANKELVAFLATALGCHKDDLSIVSGVTSRIKLIRVDAH